MKKFIISILIGSILIVFTSLTSNKEDNEPLTYLALGDSYTIGESVGTAKNWPHQLVDSLHKRGIEIKLNDLIAKTGWRTDDMLNAARDKIKQKKYDIVSLLIGVNNEYQGWDPEKFETEFEKCLKYAIIHCENGKNGVFVVSIPDYGYTPFGKKNQQKISARIDKYNKICKKYSKKYGVKYFNITPISRQNPDDTSLVAKDDLHPSAKQYGLWVAHMVEGVVELINGID